MDLKKTELPAILRDLRLESGFTQQQLASRLNLSRETISAVENAKPETIDALAVETIAKWWSICRTKANESTRSRFVSQLMGFFKIFADKI